MKVEVQIRTIAMDFWASLEHQIKYKKDISNSDEIIGRLKNCADVIAETDLEMQKIRQENGEGAGQPGRCGKRFSRKLKKFDVPIV